MGKGEAGWVGKGEAGWVGKGEAGWVGKTRKEAWNETESNGMGGKEKGRVQEQLDNKRKGERGRQEEGKEKEDIELG